MGWIERQRHFIDYTLSSLWRRKWKNLALLIVYTLVVFVIASVLFFTQAIRDEARGILEAAPAVLVQRMVAGRHDLIPVSYAAKIQGIRGVQAVQGRLWGYYYHPAARANYTVMARETFPFGDDEIVVGDGVLRTWGTIRQGRVYVQAYDGKVLAFKIVQAFTASTDLVSADLILTSVHTFRRWFGIPEGVATDLALTIRKQRESPVIAEKIVRMLPDTRPILRDEIQRTYASLFDWRSGYVIVLLSGAVLAFFIFAWDKATGLSAEEKTEIGILKALGWDTSDVLAMKFWEGTVISLSAFVMGVIGAYVHVFLASASLFEHALKGWAVLYPRFTLQPTVDLYPLSVLFFLTVLPYTLITIVPTWKAAVTDPDIVMRQG